MSAPPPTVPPIGEPAPPKDLASRVFADTRFQIGWAIFLAVIVTKVAWPIHNIALVCWVNGVNAYSRDGVRVLPGKPTKFSNGELVPNLPDFVIGMVAFLAFGVGLTMLLILALHVYERLRARKKAGNPAIDSSDPA